MIFRLNIERIAAEREEMVDNLTQAYMSGKVSNLKEDNYSPLLSSNFDEFIQEMPADTRVDILEYLQELDIVHNYKTDLREKMMAAIGRTIYLASNEYFEKLAAERADREIPSVTELIEDAKDRLK